MLIHNNTNSFRVYIDVKSIIDGLAALPVAEDPLFPVHSDASPSQGTVPTEVTHSAPGEATSLEAQINEMRDQKEPQWERQINELKSANQNVKEELRLTLSRLADKDAEIENLCKEINLLRETVQEKNEIIAKLESDLCEKELVNQKIVQHLEDTQLDFLNLQKNAIKQINSLKQLELLGYIAHGCDAVVFKCSASNLGIHSLAVKILFNLGVPTTQVKNFFANEYEILKSLPFHKHIIPILSEFDDRPPPDFLKLFPPDITEFVVNKITGQTRTTTCIIMPILNCLESYLATEYRHLGVKGKIRLISDIADGLHFLFENDVIHRDMKINNLLIDNHGKVLISDFGAACKVSPSKMIHIPPGGSRGGNLVHLAPELRSLNTNIADSAVLVDLSKQPSFELGMLAHEIFFGDNPAMSKCGEDMDFDYFKNLCADASHEIPELFDWIRGLLSSNPKSRTAFLDGYAELQQIKKIVLK